MIPDLKRDIVRDIELLSPLDVAAKLRLSGGARKVALVAFYSTHFHTAQFAIDHLDELGLDYRVVSLPSVTLEEGGGEIDLAQELDIAIDAEMFWVTPYDPHQAIATAIHRFDPDARIADLTLDLVFPGHLDQSILRASLPRIRQLYELLDDARSKSCLAEILLARWTGLRGWLSVDDYECYFHSSVMAAAIANIADCGSHVGNVALGFLHILKPDRGIVCFEPDAENLEALRSRRATDALFSRRVELVHAGVWSEPGRAILSGSGHSTQIRDAGAEGQTDLVALDDFFRDRPHPDFIKMDIEGSEREALAGAREIIAASKPALAISLYHRPDDLWELPLLIHEINPNYKFHMGHHSRMLYETVLYCN